MLLCACEILLLLLLMPPLPCREKQEAELEEARLREEMLLQQQYAGTPVSPSGEGGDSSGRGTALGEAHSATSGLTGPDGGMSGTLDSNSAHPHGGFATAGGSMISDVLGGMSGAMDDGTVTL